MNPAPARAGLPPRLKTLLETAGPDFAAALNAQAVQRARAFISGIKSYQTHPAQRDVPSMPTLWSEGTTALHDYHPDSTDAPIVLAVPSLINRSDILDLESGASFLRYMAAAGWRPLLVNWNEPGETEKKFALNDYVQRLSRILNFIRRAYPQQKIHLLGYCMGGLLALALASLQPAHIKNLILLATPWNFHQPDPHLAEQLASFALANQAAWQMTGVMPTDILYYLFSMLQPLQALDKFTAFAALDSGSEEARHFVVLEDWLNNGVPLPHQVAQECFAGWYGANATARLEWNIGRHIIDPQQLTMPCYVVVPGRDRIVPPESALPLARSLPHATLHEPMTGHIGLMSSRNAPQQVWKPLLHWLDQHR